ncbi:MAG: succinylglutamate desuccinylase/aspartoacylase family protein [Alphaproteobacteria bacterium]
MTAGRKAFEIDGIAIEPGKHETVNLPFGQLANHTPVTLPVRIFHGRRDGPVLFISAAVHGDEIIGVEIIRRLLKSPVLRGVRGTLITVPIVNAFGFINHSRYLPDRRDLNRSFPGSPNGSLAAQLAHLFMTQIVQRSDFGIDLHSAAIHRSNLPQIRVSPDCNKAEELALAFSPPVIVKAGLREGSLRATALEAGVEMLLYEAGEGLRFDEIAVRAGVSGILRVMKALDMISTSRVKDSRVKPHLSQRSSWTRAPASGVFRALRTTGDMVEAGEAIGVISDPFGAFEEEVLARFGGLVIGRAVLPVVNQGDALLHIAEVDQSKGSETRIERNEQELQADPLLDEDEII